ncbi:fanconi-associated nuclease 1-like protein, partial [Dinothrombium tinctorium]
PSQRLYVRLFIRKHGWKRKIVYPEIDSDLHPLIKELIASNFVLPSSSLRSLKTSLELLDNSELKVCAKDLKGVKLNGFNRDAMMKAIMMHVKSNRSIESHFYNNRESNSISFNVLKRVLKILNDSAFCINHETSRVFKRMALLSFPPDLNEDEIGVAFGSKLFNLLQLTKGEIKYPYYTVNKVREVFKARQDLINYEESCELESDILTAIEKRDYMKILTDYLPKTKNLYSQFISNEALNADRKLPDYLRIFTAGHILIRCFTHCVGVLEQQKHFEEAVAMYKFLLNQTVYCQDYRGKWYERLTIVYDHHLKKQLKAYNNICKALKDSKVRIGHRYSLYRRGLKLKEILNKFFIELPEYSFNIPDVTIEAPAFCKQVGDRKNLFIQTDEDGSVTFISVEDAVLNHYKESGYPSGLHSEGLVYHSLFGLLFWDIIYYDKKLVADAFRTPYQTIPLDLNSDIFYTRRRELIQQKINKLRSFTADDMCNEMESVWNENKGCLCLVNWEKCDIKQLKEIVHCMKVNTIIEVCEMLAKHFRHTRSGFPDLLIWNADKNLIKAIEVKGPGDQLSPKQSLWINNLNKAGLRTEVCFVKAKKC